MAPWGSGSYVGGVAFTVKISRSPTWFTMPNFVTLGSTAETHVGIHPES